MCATSSQGNVPFSQGIRIMSVLGEKREGTRFLSSQESCVPWDGLIHHVPQRPVLCREGRWGGSLCRCPPKVPEHHSCRARGGCSLHTCISKQGPPRVPGRAWLTSCVHRTERQQPASSYSLKDKHSTAQPPQEARFKCSWHSRKCPGSPFREGLLQLGTGRITPPGGGV